MKINVQIPWNTLFIDHKSYLKFTYEQTQIVGDHFDFLVIRNDERDDINLSLFTTNDHGHRVSRTIRYLKKYELITRFAFSENYLTIRNLDNVHFFRNAAYYNNNLQYNNLFDFSKQIMGKFDIDFFVAESATKNGDVWLHERNSGSLEYYLSAEFDSWYANK